MFFAEVCGTLLNVGTCTVCFYVSVISALLGPLLLLSMIELPVMTRFIWFDFDLLEWKLEDGFPSMFTLSFLLPTITVSGWLLSPELF